MLEFDPPEKPRDHAVIASGNLMPRSIRKHDVEGAKIRLFEPRNNICDNRGGGLRHVVKNAPAPSRRKDSIGSPQPENFRPRGPFFLEIALYGGSGRFPAPLQFPPSPSMHDSPLFFGATGNIQSFIVPVTGLYEIEASGAQGGPGGGPGGKGARVKGTFFLREGETLQIIVGRQGTAGTTAHQPAGGGGGGTFVWKATHRTLLPPQPLLAAGGGGGGNGGDGVITTEGARGAGPGGRDGQGGETDVAGFHYSGGGGVGWNSDGHTGSSPTFCGGGSLWRGGAGANYCGNAGGHGGFGGGGGGAFLGNGSGGGGGYSGGGGGTQDGPGAGGGGSFNAGVAQTNTPGAQLGDGCVSIQLVNTEAPLLPSGHFDPFDGAASTSDGLPGKGYM